MLAGGFAVSVESVANAGVARPIQKRTATELIRVGRAMPFVSLSRSAARGCITAVKLLSSCRRSISAGPETTQPWCEHAADGWRSVMRRLFVTGGREAGVRAPRGALAAAVNLVRWLGFRVSAGSIALSAFPPVAVLAAPMGGSHQIGIRPGSSDFLSLTSARFDSHRNEMAAPVAAWTGGHRTRVQTARR